MAQNQTINSERRSQADRYEMSKRRFFDPNYKRTVVKVLPGEHYVTTEPGELLATVLGSCVSACIRDPQTGVGGMNHFMLPKGKLATWEVSSSILRYGNHAMEVLINEVIKTGCPRDRLEIKVFGGASMMGNSADVGARNAEFVTRYLQNEGLMLESSDLGGQYGRRIVYSPESGVVKRLLLKRKSDKTVFKEETSFRATIDSKRAGEIELFD